MCWFRARRKLLTVTVVGIQLHSYAFLLVNYRKNTVEIELAKTRIELMHINSQLMEAVQQKVELSQQLDQWQVRVAACS